jgi:hypothetical protein
LWNTGKRNLDIPLLQGAQVWDFGRLDCHDFYTIKSSLVGAFGV